MKPDHVVVWLISALAGIAIIIIIDCFFLYPGTVVIPRDANVYFALIAAKTDIVKATLLLVERQT